jgi:tRNA pseudouridine38-40 synthase
VIEYDGTELSGWQRQLNGPSVQQHLEEALAQMLGSPVRVDGASRTDAGVHALGQVANFRTTAAIPTDGFRRGLNGLLPPSIAVVVAEEVPHEFHARFSARGKRYRYSLLGREDRSPLVRHRVWHRPRPLSPEAIEEVARPLVGEHDFSAFRASGCSAKHAVRAITGISARAEGDHLVHIEIRGNAFLRNMVRIIAGTIVDRLEGRIGSNLLEILESCQRDRAGQTAPAQGLTLVEVLYPPS